MALPPFMEKKMNKPVAMQATKWLKVQLLADATEMEGLFTALGDFSICISGAVVPKGGGEIPQKAFLKVCEKYIETLKAGQVPLESLYRQMFSTVFNKDPNALFTVQVGADRQLLRVAKPVIQLQPHSMDYSPYDGKFRTMVYGMDSILWGIQFSYPQLFQDPETKEPENVDESERFPNTTLFKGLQRWIRNQTVPTPFIVQGKKINVPMRLGKKCLSWINRHPQLAAKHIQVAE